MSSPRRSTRIATKNAFQNFQITSRYIIPKSHQYLHTYFTLTIPAQAKLAFFKDPNGNPTKYIQCTLRDLTLNTSSFRRLSTNALNAILTYILHLDLNATELNRTHIIDIILQSMSFE